MAQLKLCLDVIDYELTHVTVLLSVLDKRDQSRLDNVGRDGEYEPSAAQLRMTLPELHIFTRALVGFDGPLEVTTPVKLGQSGPPSRKYYGNADTDADDEPNSELFEQADAAE